MTLLRLSSFGIPCAFTVNLPRFKATQGTTFLGHGPLAYLAPITGQLPIFTDCAHLSGLFHSACAFLSSHNLLLPDPTLL